MQDRPLREMWIVQVATCTSVAMCQPLSSWSSFVYLNRICEDRELLALLDSKTCRTFLIGSKLLRWADKLLEAMSGRCTTQNLQRQFAHAHIFSLYDLTRSIVST